MRKLITKKIIFLRYIVLCEALVSLDAFIEILLRSLDYFNDNIILDTIMISALILFFLSAVIVCKNDRINFTLMTIENEA